MSLRNLFNFKSEPVTFEQVFEAMTAHETSKAVRLIHRAKPQALEMTDDIGRGSLLIMSINRNLPEVADSLIKKGVDLNCATYGGDTALHRAIYYRNFDLSLKLAINGADIYKANRDGETPLMMAEAEMDSFAKALVKDYEFSKKKRKLLGKCKL